MNISAKKYFVIFYILSSFVFSQTSTSTLVTQANSEEQNKLVSRQTFDYSSNLDLLSFNAIFNNNKVDISWSTLTEKSNDYFVIEKSKDGTTFETVLLVKGAGQSNSIIDYVEVDFTPFKGMSYYRLKQTNHEGKVQYSVSVPVNYHFNITPYGLSVLPNVSDEELEIDISGVFNEQVLVLARDVSGKEVFSKVSLKKEGKHLVVIESENKLSQGTYLVIASSRNELYSQKIIVK